MATFAPPVLKAPEGEDVKTVIAYTPQEQIEAQNAHDDQKRKDDIKARKEERILAKKEADQRRAKEKEDRRKEQGQIVKAIRQDKEDDKKKDKLKVLNEQSAIFSDQFRSGILGKFMAFAKNREEMLQNAIEVVKDSAKDTFLGKTLADQKLEVEGYFKNSFLKRILGAEKYTEGEQKDRVENPEDRKPEIEEAPKSDTPDITAKMEGVFEKLGNFLSNFMGGKTEANPEGGGGLVSFPNKIDVGEDETAITKQVPLLERISDTISSLYESFLKFTESSKDAQEEADRKANASNIAGKLGGVKDRAVEVVKKAGGWISGLLNDFGIWTLVGMNTLVGTLKTTILGALGTVGKMIVKAFPVVALATGLYIAIGDAVAGWFSADAWGVSKIAGMIGGLLGGLNNGVMGMLQNAGKWALIGAGIGSVVPVVGTLLGGLIGAVFGGILGYFGGEKIAQVVQNAADWAWNKFNEVVDWVKWFFTELPVKIGEFIKSTFDAVVQWGKEKIDSIRNSIKDFMDSVEAYFKKFFTLDYWLGQEGVAQPNPPKIESSMDNIKTLDGEEGPDKTPVKVEIQPSGAFDDMLKSMDDLSKNIEASPTATAKDAAAMRIYEKSIENSVTNNTTANNDYSRTTNQSVVSGSYNKASINLAGSPNPRNQESSSFGTRSFLNGGFGNPSRF